MADSTFEIHAHRGGTGYRPENTLAAFAHALEIGVHAIELDVRTTADGRAVVIHDGTIGPAKYADTGPATPGDPAYPYVGKRVDALTLEQLRTLDAGTLVQPEHPEQVAAPGEGLPTLPEVFELLAAAGVRLNIELKVDPGTTGDELAAQVVGELRAAGRVDVDNVQSFDWPTLTTVHELEPRLAIAALTVAGTDPAGNAELVRSAAALGAGAIAPMHGHPNAGGVGDAGYQRLTTAEFVEQAHAAGLRVIPWTVDDQDTMRALIDDGVDGIITDYPLRLRDVLVERGLTA